GRDHARAGRLRRGEGRAGAGDPGPGHARSGLCHREDTRERLREQEDDRGRPGRPARTAAAGHRAPRRHLGHGELQGEPAPEDPSRAAGRRRRRRVWGPALPGARGQHLRRHRGALQPPSPGERQRQLRQGRAAGAGEDSHRDGPGLGARAAPGHVGGPHRLREVSEVAGRPEPPHVNPWIVAVAVMFATFMEVLDTTVVNVSLPHIAGSLDATVDESTWALTSYLVANAIILPLAGWLANHYSWRWVFYTNIPVGVVSLVMTMLYIFDPPYIERKSDRVDYWGIGLLAVGVGALQFMLDKGQEEDWFASDLMRALLVMAVVGLVAFVARELTTGDPVVDLHVFKERTYTAGVFLMTVLGFVLYGSLVLLPIM